MINWATPAHCNSDANNNRTLSHQLPTNCKKRGVTFRKSIYHCCVSPKTNTSLSLVADTPMSIYKPPPPPIPRFQISPFPLSKKKITLSQLWEFLKARFKKSGVYLGNDVVVALFPLRTCVILGVTPSMRSSTSPPARLRHSPPPVDTVPRRLTS
jgi:hypothetical protein